MVFSLTIFIILKRSLFLPLFSCLFYLKLFNNIPQLNYLCKIFLFPFQDQTFRRVFQKRHFEILDNFLQNVWLPYVSKVLGIEPAIFVKNMHYHQYLLWKSIFTSKYSETAKRFYKRSYS